MNLCLSAWLAGWLAGWLERGSVERGQLWDEIAALLNSLEKPGFKVTFRSVRDRYGLLLKKYKTKWNEEGKSSGTNPDYTELDGALMDLIQRFDEADSERKRETNEKKLKIKNELAKAQEMRQTSFETFCQMKKCKESYTETSQKRRRPSFFVLTGLFVILFRKFRKRIADATRGTINKEART